MNISTIQHRLKSLPHVHTNTIAQPSNFAKRRVKEMAMHTMTIGWLEKAFFKKLAKHSVVAVAAQVLAAHAGSSVERLPYL